MPRRVPDQFKLLFGPYEPPPLTKGDRATCLYRDADVVITAWSDSRLSWPRCRALGHRGGSGLLVDEELARAICSESATALEYWFGVANSTVTLWRTALGVKGLTGTEGTRRLVQAGQERRVAKLRAKGAPRSNFVDSPYNTSGPWSTAQGGGKSWMGQGNMPLSIAAPARAVVANPMDLLPNNIAP